MPYYKKAMIIRIAVAVVALLIIAREAQAAWLSGWDKRIKMTIDSGDITADLSNFPILVYLSTSSGRNSDDVSAVFDELTDDANRKKIAVTKSDGTTECYVEIEDWDDASEKAYLWVKVSGTNSVSSSSDTDLYLYYDIDHADNATYVGDVDSAAAANVWDASYVAVYHMSEASWNGTTDEVKDSKGSVDGTAAFDATTTATGKMGRGGTFDGTGDYVDFGTVDLVGGYNSMTVSAWVKPAVASTGTHNIIISQGVVYLTTEGEVFTCNWDNGQNVDFYVRAGDDDAWAYYNDAIQDTNWHYYVAVYDNSNAYVFVDNTEGDSSPSHSGTMDTADVDLRISSQNDDTYPWYGTLDEIRVSNDDRSAAWNKASFESGKDDLLDFASEEASEEITLDMKGSVTLKQNVNMKTQ